MKDCNDQWIINVHRPEMITARNEIDAHVQDFMLNDELLLFIQRAPAHCCHLSRLLKMLDVFSLCVLVEQCFSYQ
jgi:hypothetical protein